MTILDLSKAISRKRCKIGGKLLLITNRKSHMRFQLVSKSVTLNGLECKPKNPVFTTLHAMQTRSSNENSVCLSARPSVCQTRDLSQNGKKDRSRFLYYTKTIYIYPNFLRRRMVGGGDPFYEKCFVNQAPLERHRQFSTDIRP